jgi:periplasmic divalent cation tolerance protein
MQPPGARAGRRCFRHAQCVARPRPHAHHGRGEARVPRSTAALQVIVAVPNARVATEIGNALLAQRLCACAQTIGPITSRYRWQGKIETAREYLLLLKTRATLFAAVQQAVRRLHPYAVPEIAAQPLALVHEPYLNWLLEATRADPRARGVHRPARARRHAAGKR